MDNIWTHHGWFQLLLNQRYCWMLRLPWFPIRINLRVGRWIAPLLFKLWTINHRNSVFSDLLSKNGGCASEIPAEDLKRLSSSTFYYLWAVMQHSQTSLVPKIAVIEEFDEYVRVGSEVKKDNYSLVLYWIRHSSSQVFVLQTYYCDLWVCLSVNMHGVYMTLLQCDVGYRAG